MSKAPFRGNSSVQDVHQVSQLARRAKSVSAAPVVKAVSVVVAATPSGAAGEFKASAPLSYDGAVLMIPQAAGASDGYLSSLDWATFSAKEPGLGAPLVDGMVLVSTAAQVRSWMSLPTMPSFVDAETPSGLINGINTVFTLAHTPAAGSVHVYLGASSSAVDRLPQSQYSVSSTTVTFVTPPPTGSVLFVDYRY